MAIYRRPLWSLLTLVVIPATLHAGTVRLNLRRQFPAVQAENKVWLGTPSGLFQASLDDRSFRRVPLPPEAPSSHVEQLLYDDEWLWCVLDTGLAALHIRLNEWLHFDAAHGLPSDRVLALDSRDSQIWAATGDGAARFDMLIEEWEVLGESQGGPTGPIRDILAQGEDIWLLTEGAFLQYDSRFEKWRHHRVEADPTARLRRAFFLDGDLWLLCDRGLVRFDPALQTQQLFFTPYLNRANLLEVLVEDGRLWCLTSLGIYLYDPDAQAWRDFEGNAYLRESTLVQAYVTGSEVWVLTDRNALVWDRLSRDWGVLDYSSGLSATPFSSVHVSGDMVFLLRPQGCEYRFGRDDVWQRHSFAGSARAGSGRQILGDLLDSEEGGYIPLGETRWGWAGSHVSLLHDYERRFGDGSGDPDVSAGSRLDLKSQLPISGSRQAMGFYNNTDYAEIMYGLGYRNRGDGLVREANWGDLDRESADAPFHETTSLFGSSVWMQDGPKTSRYRRSLLTLKARTGERRSQKTFEHYRGATTRREVSRRDVDYVRRQFFAFPALDEVVGPRGLQVWLDDLRPATDDPNTRHGMTIASVTGDFDQLRATEHFTYHAKAGAVCLLRYVDPRSTIVVCHQTQGGAREAVLQYGESISTARHNVYYLDAQQIIPASFRLQIADAAGQPVPLDQFGLDGDRDGLVDSRWIDYERGLLVFPAPRPFRGAAYDPEQPQSTYVLQARYETRLSLIQLQHRDLVRGTETVRLDGVAAEGGNDYVLDYTNGTLVFVREGVVNADSRIEIEYEFYTGQGDSHLHSARLAFSPHDDLNVQGDWSQLSDDGSSGGAPGSGTDLLTAHAEARHRVGGYDLRVVPGVAYQPRDGGLTGTHFEGLISSPSLRVQARYEHFAPEYANLYRPQSVLGDVESRLALDATADVGQHARLTAEWQGTRAAGRDDNASPTDRRGRLGLLLHRPEWPSWQVRYQHSTTAYASGTQEKRFLQNRWEYRLPGSVSQRLLLQTVHAEAFLRLGRQWDASSAGDGEEGFRQGYVRVNTTVSDRFRGGLFYRRNDLDVVGQDDVESPLSRSERLLLDLSHEEWRLAQVNVRVENTLDQDFHEHSPVRSARLSQFSQADLRLSPGRLWSTLSPLHFELNISQTLFGLGATGASPDAWVWQVFSGDARSLDDSQLIRNCFVRNELRPSSRWHLFSLVEWGTREAGPALSSLKTRQWRWSEKLDMRLGYRTRLSLQYRGYSQHRGYGRRTRYYEPSTWIQHRWTPALQSIVSAAFRRTQDREGYIRNLTHYWEGRGDIIVRTRRIQRLRRVEIRQSLAATRRHTSGHVPERLWQLASVSSLDSYPLSSTIVRAQFEVTRELDRLYEKRHSVDIGLSLRASLRF